MHVGDIPLHPYIEFQDKMHSAEWTEWYVHVRTDCTTMLEVEKHIPH